MEKNNEILKTYIFDVIKKDIENLSLFEKIFNHVFDEILDDEFYDEKIYDDEDENLKEILIPSIRNLYIRIYQNPPSLFKDKKIELFQLYFNINEFLKYFKNLYPSVKYSLKDFKNLDRTSETIGLMIDNYIGYLVDKVRTSSINNSIDKDIRNAKINKII